MKKIEIAEPCHESWNDFTPTQRGAFCGKCQINVIDFSEKSNSEIQLILVENSGKKICGRFTNKQLDSLNSDFYLWQNQSTQTFNSKFVLALVMVFGLTLFSCANDNHIKTLGKFQVENFMVPDSLVANEPVDSIPKIKNTDCMVKGKVAQPEVEIQHTLGEIEPVEIFTMGDIAMPPEPIIAGGIEMTTDYEQHMLDSIPEQLITDNETPDLIKLTDKFEINVFPNPVISSTKLKINVLVTENYHIDLTDMNGKIIRTELNKKLDKGIHILEINFDELPKGIYLVKINTNTQDETIKLIKS
jgi:hypothetical protein